MRAPMPFDCTLLRSSMSSRAPPWHKDKHEAVQRPGPSAYGQSAATRLIPTCTAVYQGRESFNSDTHA